MEERGYQQMVQKLVESLSSVQARSKKKHNIERLKSLGAVVFEGSTDPIDVEVWLNLLEKCFEVMDCPQERRVKLATFLLQNKVEGWSKSIKVRNMQSPFLRQVGGGKGMACRVYYIRLSSDEESSQITYAFSFKPFASGTAKTLSSSMDMHSSRAQGETIYAKMNTREATRSGARHASRARQAHSQAS
ncbi:uncharacterized protein E5676_scaffold2044G00320 [Cucumis melo var. makuwa]|uniref:Uncharacterized protein n=1 Tax=Cucumis melo var. makuwa TaxID=1194695 RepID=A0A5D3BPE1_CUCMM|nr:uncharacterized protein E5676_scaffold2044G00320 [Cucumis melo var. makuwa]